MTDKLLTWAWRLAVLVLLALALAAIPRPHECGTCGALTFDRYTIRALDGSPVDVCPACYAEVRAEEVR